eukprot:CAMPEP_0182895944 /NCGR_PEP_ID=MMETSP0034_2-20130328/25984_1 /TAXON_ID=156128 /ORGANISM="Nephroselmis pyriformis, Strain CCMP717" /LENGTH=124 /DNA_ID=CAMNT_0025029799 /DNA_START=121 /DNA_END=491 /DNA_ORIENTATION=+
MSTPHTKTPVLPTEFYRDALDSEKENINPATGRHMRDDWRPEDVLRERLPQFASSHAGLKTPTQDPVTPQTSERTPLADITPMFVGVKPQAFTVFEDEIIEVVQPAKKKDQAWGYGIYGGDYGG